MRIRLSVIAVMLSSVVLCSAQTHAVKHIYPDDVASSDDRPLDNTDEYEWCIANPDAAPTSAHPECYCEQDDETLAPGTGC